MLVLETQWGFPVPHLPSFLYGDSHLFRSKYYKKWISKASLSKLCAVSVCVSVHVVYSQMGESKSQPPPHLRDPYYRAANFNHLSLQIGSWVELYTNLIKFEL